VLNHRWSRWYNEIWNKSEEIFVGLTGTTNQITVTDNGDGTYTLSTPQNTHTGASPEFTGLTLSGLTASCLVSTDGSKALTSIADGSADQYLKTDGAGAYSWATITVADEKVKIDSGATAGYIGAASNDGVLRVDATLGYADGGDYITLSLDSTLKTNYDAAYTHVSSDGTDHGYIDQDIQTTASPTHAGLTLSGLTASRVVFTDGTKALASGASDITAAEMEELTDGSTTTLHDHALTIGDAITSGTAQRVLYEDSSNNLAQTAGFEFDGTDALTMPSGGSYQINGSDVLNVDGTSTVRVGMVGNTATGRDCVLAGTEILSSQTTTSSYENVLIGHDICDHTTSAMYKNVIIGDDICPGATVTLRRNVFIGEAIGAGMTGVCEGNVGLGSFIFTALTAGSDNFALGYASMAYGTSFSGCVAIGQAALRDCNSNNVVGIGRDVGKLGTGGAEVVSIGFSAGYNTSARRNINIGGWAARWAFAGQNNFFGGYEVAKGTTYYNAYRNVVIGDQAFLNITSNDDDNLILGYQSHYTNGVSDTVALGPYSGYHNATSSRLIIDNQNRSSAANEVVQSLIHGDFNATVSSQALRLNANVTIRHALYGVPDEITATDAGVAASLTTINTEVTTNGDSDLDNVTLANGTSGQIKHIYCVAVGNAADSFKITPTNMVGGTQITFAASPLGLGCTLVYADNEGWVVTANNGGTIT
jgi:hypothetical protein